MQALHKKKILHRDIKPGNMLVAEDNLLKIGDLGIGKVLKNNLTKTAIGTPHYMAPEGGALFQVTLSSAAVTAQPLHLKRG